MEKPTLEQFIVALSRYTENWGSAQKYIEAAIKKWRFTAADFWNPVYNEQWDIVSTDYWTNDEVEQNNDETSQNEGETNEWGDTNNTNNTNDTPKFIEEANSDWWEDMNNQDKLKILANDYLSILENMRDDVDKYNSGEWLSWKAKQTYKDKLNEYRKQLKEIEQSSELYKLMEDVSRDWSGKLLDNWIWNAKVNNTLRLLTAWWSNLFSDDDRLYNFFASSKWTTLDNFFSWMFDENTWVVNTMMWWAINPLSYAYSLAAWKDAQDLSKEFIRNWHKNLKDEDSVEWWNKSSNKTDKTSNKTGDKTKATKVSDINDKFKDSSITDSMSFWNDVKSEWYLDRRNIALARHLKANWIETPEEIEEYLNKYPSWKDAKQEWKNNTVNILADKVAKLNGKDIKKEDEWEKKWEFGWEWWKENEDGSKTSPDGWTTVYEDWSISFWTDDESPLNDVEWFGWEWRTINEDGSKTSPDWWTTVYEDWSISFWTDDESPLNDEISTYDWGDKSSDKKDNKWKDYSDDTEEQSPENNEYLFLDETVKNIDYDKDRIKYLEKRWYKVNKNGFYEKDWVKTKVYKDWRYNPKTEEIAKGWIWTATKNINKSAQDEMDILLQEQGYNWPKNSEWHFIPMNDDVLNWAWDKEETKTSKKTVLRKSKTNDKKEKKEDKENKKGSKVSKSSSTILNLIKNKK